MGLFESSGGRSGFQYTGGRSGFQYTGGRSCFQCFRYRRNIFFRK